MATFNRLLDLLYRLLNSSLLQVLDVFFDLAVSFVHLDAALLLEVLNLLLSLLVHVGHRVLDDVLEVLKLFVDAIQFHIHLHLNFFGVVHSKLSLKPRELLGQVLELLLT